MTKSIALVIKALLITILLINEVSAQQCSENTNVNGIAGTGFSNGTIGQSFTACSDGKLASVSVQAGNASSGFNNVIVQIFSGDGFGGSILATTAQVNVRANRTTTFSLSSNNIQVVEGQKYTARFLTQSGTPMMAYGTGANSAIDYYSRGRIHGVAQSHNDMFFSAVIETLSDPVKTPEDDAVAVTRDTEVKLNFSRAMEALTGNITINNTTDATSQTIDVTTLVIDGGEIVMPFNIPLEGGKDFEIIIPSNTLRATNQIPFPGIVAGEWTFSTSTSPFATLSTTSSDLTNDAVFPFTIDFSDIVTGFDLTDFIVTNGVASNLAGSDDSFTFDITPSADGEVIVSLPEDVVEAGTSNGNDSTGYSLTYDGTAPSVVLDTDVSGTIQTSVFDIEVVFSEPIVGFEDADLQLVNAEVLSVLNTNDSLFTVSLRAQAEGQITVDLAAGMADDLAGNSNTAAPSIIDVTFSVDLDSDVLSFYPFDGNANDTVSTGFNGTVTGATLTTGFDGSTNGAYSFDGSDRITFGDTPIGAGSFSIGFWVKIPEGLGTQNRIILEKRPVCSEGRFFTLLYRNNATNGHEIVASQRNNGSATAPIASNLTVGEWMHVTYVKDNDNLSSSIFINGVQESEVAWTATYNFENNTNLIAGSGPCVGADGTLGFIGDLDDMHVYDRALTAVEIDLLVPFALKSASAENGSNIQAGQNLTLNFNKNIIQSSINSTNIIATGSVSGAIANIGISSSQDNITITPPATGWLEDEDITISISGLLAENGTTLSATNLTYSVIEEETLGLILHYPISGNANEAIGDIAGQDGTVSGALFAEGFDGDPFGALSFDGTDDVVTLGDAPISSESFSMSMWLKVPADGSTTQNSVILSKRDACSEGRMINIWYIRSGDKFRVTAGLRDNASAGSVSTGFSFPVEEWVNVTFAKDNDTKQYRLIVNGVLEAESSWTLNSVNVENSTSITLGTSPCVGNGEMRFDGLIDDLRIYDRVIQPRVISVAPTRGTVNAAIDTVVTINFDRVVDVNSLEASTISVTDLNDQNYPYTTSFSNGDSVLTITPDSNFPKGKEILISVDTLSAQIGSDFLPFQTSFTTVSSKLLSYSPANGESDVDSLQTISFKFDNEIDMTSLEAGIKVIGSHHGPVEGDFTMPATDSVVFTPTTPYFPNEMITVYVTSDLQDVGGESISNTRAFKFHVESGVFTNPTLSFELTKLTTSGATASPRVLVPADMDGDGDLDLVGGDDSSRRLLFFENLGSGNFGTATSIAAGRGYFDVKVTDFDLDGDLDVVSVDRSVSQGLYWYENDGAGNFTEDQIVTLTNTDTRSIAIADYNKDGMMDVAVASFGSNRFTVYQQDGSSLFAAANASQPIFLSEADWNGDGNMDIIAGNFGGSVVRWTNSGIGTFSGSGLHSASQIRSVIPFDIDKDGDMDIVYSSQTGNQIGVLQNDGSGSFTNVQVGSVLGPHRLDVGDVDGDGDFDIVYTTAGTGADINFHYLENSGTLTLWTSQRLMPNETFSGTFTQTASFADLDNDGDLDVAATDADGGFYVFENMIIDLNAAPIISNPVADQTLAEDDSEGLVIDVSSVFSDNEGDTFTITASSDNAAVTAVINGTNLEIDIATANFFGVVNITLTADDGNGTNNDAFILTVTSVNDAPVFDLSVTSITVDEDFTTTETITVTQNQPDDEDAPTYSIAPSNSSLATVTIDETTGEVTVVGIADAFGTEDFTVTANDGAAENNTATQTLTLTVNGVNDAPVLSTAIADVSFDEDPTVNGGVDLTNNFTDADGETLTFTLAVTAGDDLAELSLNGGTISIIPEPNAFGTIEVSVTAEDAIGETVSDDFTIVINSVNDAPTFTTSGDLTLTKDFTTTEVITVTADAIPFREESQVVTYTMSPASISFANVVIDQSSGEVSVTAVANEFGAQEFTITANDGEAANNTASQTFTLTVLDKNLQVVTFTGVADKTFGDPDFDITASVDSSLPVNFSVVSGGISIAGSKKARTDSNLATFTITGAGTAIIRASNDGNDTYAPLQEDIVIEVAKADQILTVEEVTTKATTAQPITINASIDTNLDLTYSVSGPATNVDNLVTLDGTEGTIIVIVTQAGTDNYNQASESISFDVVAKQAQTITFTDVPDLTYGAGDQTLSATSSSTLAVNFNLISGPATLSGNTLSVTGAGDIVVEATQAGDDAFLEASVEQTIVVSKADLTISADDQSINYGDAIPALTYQFAGFVNGESEADLNATISISTTADGTGQSDAGSYPIALIVTPSKGGDNYNFSTTDATLTINKLDQVITIDPIEDKEPTDTSFDVVASVDSGLDLTYDITGPATIAGTSVTLDGTEGTVSITVSQAGDLNHNAAFTSITFEVTVVLALEGGLSEAIKIYPNPVTEYIMIDTNELVDLRFYGLNGQLVNKFIQVTGRVDVSTLDNGTYLLEVSNSQESKTIRIHKAN